MQVKLQYYETASPFLQVGVVDGDTMVNDRQRIPGYFYVFGKKYSVKERVTESSDDTASANTAWDSTVYIRNMTDAENVNKEIVEHFLDLALKECAAGEFADCLTAAVAVAAVQRGFFMQETPEVCSEAPLPSSFKLYGQNFTVEISEGPLSSSQLGESGLKDHKVWLRKMKSTQQMEETLVHEWVHMAVESMRLESTETQVAVMSLALYSQGFRIK